ncbi:unnamed protein product [Eruca vesicaria subsp. sativa]|uniref:Uncharacterized protein n=1 Tax=Eruca vesicaria subsp. sativa TaxID=29727 RepID=A0ABC8KBH8_ERUVS|nr:unnamed protein product [Eruca vesicaria subsp. sativa]
MGAISMVLFRGPALLGDKDADFTMNHEISGKCQSEPTKWLVTGFNNLGFGQWHIGVLCLIGNCMCMAAFLDIQLSHKHQNYGLFTWSDEIIGPALVALYNPLQPAASAFLRETFLVALFIWEGYSCQMGGLAIGCPCPYVNGSILLTLIYIYPCGS